MSEFWLIVLSAFSFPLTIVSLFARLRKVDINEPVQPLLAPVPPTY